MPPLRDHKDDLPLLTEHLLRSINEKHARNARGVSTEVADLFRSYTWPGNIRELRNVLERAAIACDRDLISRQHLPADFGRGAAAVGDLSAIRFPIGTTVEAVEQELILQTLAATNNNKTRAADLLGISLKTLHNKLKEYEARKSGAGGKAHAASSED
jgi:DNA-binding NtrC family response regulator